MRTVDEREHADGTGEGVFPELGSVETKDVNPQVTDGGTGLILPPTRREKIRPATPMESLLSKMDAWLLQQPEFIAILNAPRSTRREAASLLAKHITTYPMRGQNFGGYLGPPD